MGLQGHELVWSEGVLLTLILSLSASLQHHPFIFFLDDQLLKTGNRVCMDLCVSIMGLKQVLAITPLTQNLIIWSIRSFKLVYFSFQS